MTNNEILKGLAANIMTSDYTEKKRNEIALAVSRVYADFRRKLLVSYFEGATESELQKEVDAFNADTKQGTCKVIIASETKTTDDGKLLDDDGNVMSGASSFATVVSTDKDGNVTKQRLVFRFQYVADTPQRNISIVSNWLAFRETRDDSFAAAKARENEKLAKKLASLKSELLTAVLADDAAKVVTLKAEIKAITEKIG